VLTLEQYAVVKDRMHRMCAEPRIVIIGGGGYFHPALLRRLYPDARMYCFEPAVERLQKLGDLPEALSLQLVPKALGNANTYTQLHISAAGMCNSLFKSQPGPFEHLQRQVGVETVPMVRLDDWCVSENVDPADVGCVYLDIQGAELMALHGAPKVLEHVQAMGMEVAFKPMYAGAPLHDDVEFFMKAKGFTCGVLTTAAIAPDVYGDAWYVHSARLKPETGQDLLA
jgi:FkbM family methyltransferase